MFSICFQSDQDLFTYAKTKIEKNTHSSKPDQRPMLVVS